MGARRTIREIVEEVVRSGGTDRQALDAVKAAKPDAATGLGYIRAIRKQMPRDVKTGLRPGDGSSAARSVDDAPEVQPSESDEADARSGRYDDYAEADAEAAESSIDDYDITSTPNDFNVMTLKDLIDRRWVFIPGFQRHFVWDIKRSSKLIESLILGLPVPQLFFYAQDQGKNLLIDGQQRLMSVYYFVRERFPKKEKRAHLRRIFDETGSIPDNLLKNNEYFQDFTLSLPAPLPDTRNRLNGKTYSTLSEDEKSRLDLRPLRCIVIRQNVPKDDDSSVYEVFNRLNTGGVNLHPQEIRSSMYHSEFYSMLARVNMNENWRMIVGSMEPNLHMKDVEILLRCFAMLVRGDRYRPSLARFLNAFSKESQEGSQDQRNKNEYLENIFNSFIELISKWPINPFINRNGKFSVALFEAAFVAIGRSAYEHGELIDNLVDVARLEELRDDREFVEASQRFTTTTEAVRTRMKRAKAILSAG